MGTLELSKNPKDLKREGDYCYFQNLPVVDGYYTARPSSTLLIHSNNTFHLVAYIHYRGADTDTADEYDWTCLAGNWELDSTIFRFRVQKGAKRTHADGDHIYQNGRDTEWDHNYSKQGVSAPFAGLEWEYINSKPGDSKLDLLKTGSRWNDSLTEFLKDLPLVEDIK